MWSFGHSVREIERSHHHVVIEETATTGGVWLFAGMALLVVVLWLTRPSSFESSLPDDVVGACTVIFFASFALWASVQSTYTADRRSGQLVIERRILFRTFRTAYDAHTIDRIYVRNTQKGAGLYILFKSGRNKRLSSSMGFQSLESFAIALNSALYTGRES
jgi:UDP-N-acetylmuramyl pentapeptide phosphotransferase/UDP-N-acetylglucosamine-1-phosphate transferase